MSRFHVILTGTTLVVLVAALLATTAYADRPNGGVEDTYSTQWDGHVKLVRLCQQQEMLLAITRGGALVRTSRALPEGVKLLDTLYAGNCVLYLVQHPSFPLVGDDEFPPVEDLHERITPPSDPKYWDMAYDTWLFWARKVYRP